MAIHRKSFSGGYRFTRFAGQPEPRLIDTDIPDLATLALLSASGGEIPPSVAQGDRVRAGQIIARDDRQIGGPVLASVNGRVEDIRQVSWLGEQAPAVLIRGDGTESWTPLAGFSAEWNNFEAEALEKLLYLSGVSGLPDGGIPTHFKSSAISPEEAEHIIVQMVQAEAYNPSLQVWLHQQVGERIAEGLAILARIMPRARLHLVAGGKQRSLLGEVENAGRRLGLGELSLHLVQDKYPQGREEVLVPTVLGRDFPYGYSAVNLGVVILDLQTLLQAREAVVAGRPVIDRIVALGGTGFVGRPHLRVRIGTPIETAIGVFLSKKRESRIIRNSVLSGREIPDLSQPVDPRLSMVIAIPEQRGGPPLSFARPGFGTDSYSRTFLANFLPLAKTADTNVHGEHRPCIACGYCDSVCPAGILPHLLHRYVQRGIVDEILVRYRIFDCIECNLCTYVCTSKIPLARLLREGKDRLRAEGLDPTGEEAARLRLKGLDPAGEQRP
jgi:electron transport complex protein RnfC